MKRNVTRTLAAVLCCMLLAALLPGSALAGGEFTYDVSGGSAVVTGYRGGGGYVVVPSSLGGKPVKKIGDWAFRDCTSITGIELPEGVVRIERNAFWKCSNLSEVRLPNSLTYISYNVFSWCVSLERLDIPDAVATIGKYAFSGCSGLREIHLPMSLSALHDGAFSGCFALTNVSLPAGVSSIGDDMFANCSSLTTVTMSAGVQRIASTAFRGCAGVTIVAPAGSPAAKYAENHGFATAASVPAAQAAAPSTGTAVQSAEEPGEAASPSAYQKKTNGDTTITTGAVYSIDLKEMHYICLEEETGDWFTIDEDTVLEGVDETTKPGDIVEVTVRTWQSGKSSVTRVKLVRSAEVKSVTGKVIEISTGIVMLNLKGVETDFWLLEGNSKLVNWTENSAGRTVTIQYVTVNGQNLIISITFK